MYLYTYRYIYANKQLGGFDISVVIDSPFLYKPFFQKMKIVLIDLGVMDHTKKFLSHNQL